jgi:hypothetical protein
MWHLVSQDGVEAIERLSEELHGEGDERRLDPLIRANIMIVSKALEGGGLYLIGEPPEGAGTDGHYCPVCEGIKFRNSYRDSHPDDPNAPPEMSEEEAFDYWINKPVSAVHGYLREIGVIGDAS